MMGEVLKLLTHIDNMFCVCGVMLLFIVLCIIGYAFGTIFDELHKQKEKNRKNELQSLKEEIVSDITSYYESTKENEK